MDSTNVDRNDCPIVQCKGGRVKGQTSQSLDESAKHVFVYQSIPYGKTPVGKLRFMPPQPADPWTGVLDGTVPTNIPMQYINNVILAQHLTPNKTNVDELEKDMTEDCLKLAVYTPNVYKDAKLPVMVWIYGGTFQMGFAREFDGTTLAGLHNVVVVVPNYRVGVFGFLSFGPDSVCAGNAGLLDQNLVLKWVRDNIAHFGGDKDNVTIFGESAGATSVNHQVNSPMSRGLFHKAIGASGQATNPKLFGFDRAAPRTALCEALGITEKDPTKVLEVLQSLPAKKLADADVAISRNNQSFFPVVDNKFLTMNPWMSRFFGDFARVPYIIGFNNTEGHGQLAFFGGLVNFVDGIMEEDVKKFTEQISAIPWEAAAEIAEATAQFFGEEPDDPNKYSKLFGNFCTDLLFTAPAILTANAFVDAGVPVYFYVGGFQLACNHSMKYGPEVFKKAPWCRCDHGDDLAMVWGMPFNPGRMSGEATFMSEEKMLSKKWMKYITNFAKTGNPNEGDKIEVVWPRQTTKKEFIRFDTDILTIGEKPKSDLIKFWGEDVIVILDKYLDFLGPAKSHSL